jgi:hypothetical protein
LILEPTVLSLFKRNLKSALNIALISPHPDLKKYFEGHDYILELLELHSLQKREGYKIMKKVIELSKRMSCPIKIWTETEKNVKYFERYGFKNYGQLGDNKEFMMVFQND